MNLELITRAIESATEDNIAKLFDDKETVFWVDWREVDTDSVEYCESILQTGSLSTEDVDAENEASFEMFIT